MQSELFTVTFGDSWRLVKVLGYRERGTQGPGSGRKGTAGGRKLYISQLQLLLHPGISWEQSTTEWPKEMWNCWHSFAKSTSPPAHLVSFCSEVRGSVGRAASAVGRILTQRSAVETHLRDDELLVQPPGKQRAITGSSLSNHARGSWEAHGGLPSVQCCSESSLMIWVMD